MSILQSLVSGCPTSARMCLRLAASLCLLVVAFAQTPVPLFPSAATLSVGRPIVATSTCGSPASLYCDEYCFSCNASCPVATTTAASILSSVVQASCVCGGDFPSAQGAQCCAGSSCTARVNLDAHPAQLANDVSAVTYWQSNEGQTAVNLTIALQGLVEVQRVRMTFGVNQPRAFLVSQSLDGNSWTPLQYYAQDCSFFSMDNNGQLLTGDGAICTNTVADINQTLIVFDLLTQARQRVAGGTLATSTVLQRFSRARFMRVSLRSYFTPESAQDSFGLAVPSFPFYQVADLQIIGRCACNGHANTCPSSPDGSLTCMCQHNTTGAACDTCLPLFNRKPWLRGDTVANECLPCNCNNHATSCTYNASVDSNPGSRTLGDGGVCACQDNTAGQNCDSCQPFFYLNPNASRTSPQSCAPCACNLGGTADAGVCNLASGQCRCKEGVTERDCSACLPSFYGFSSSGCSACACNTLGTVNATTVCDFGTGQCPCSPGNTGRTCAQCRVGFFQLPLAATGVCVACDAQCSDAGCLGPGSTVSACVSCRNVQAAGVCVAACPFGQYADSNRVCQPCDAQCSGGCTGAGPTMCNACASFRLGNTCVASCPNLFFADSTQTCRACNSECRNSCSGPNATDCDSCRNYFHRTQGCLARCPVGTYGDSSNTCQPCHADCDAQGCSGPLQTNCVRCLRVTSLVTSTPTCLATCPALTYLLNDTSSVVQLAGTPVCLPCNAQCARGCQGPSSLDCVGGCLNYADLSNNSNCVAACPAPTYIRNGAFCDLCSASCNRTGGCSGPLPADCFVCSTEAFLVFQNGNRVCASSCPSNMFATQEKVCQACHSLCSLVTPGCSGPAASQCNACSSLFDPVSRSCVDQCPVQFFGASNGTCLACAPQCDGCTGPATTQCVACRYFMFGSDCVNVCPVGHYANAQRRCVACDPQCSACAGPTPSDCVAVGNQTACVNVRRGQVCLAACDPTTEYVDANRNCQPCSAQCVGGCTGPLASQCQQCASVSLNNVCTTTCPSTFFVNSSTCQACSSQCTDSCFGATPSECNSCRNFQLGPTCVSRCPVGTYADTTRACITCDAECVACYGPAASQCQAAVTNGPACRRFRRGTTCVATCDALVEFVVNTTQQCQSCSPQCAAAGCSGPLASQCNVCLNYQHQGVCVSACPETHYASPNGTCLPCASECIGGCTGPAASQCVACRNVQRAGVCVPQCSNSSEYVDTARVCQACNSECLNGCKGPLATDCTTCRTWNTQGTCTATCDTSQFFADSGARTCQPCGSECSTQPGGVGCPTSVTACAVCLRVRQNGQCMASCATGLYADTTNTSTAVQGVCRACHAQCAPATACSGPAPTQCVQCATFRDIASGACVSNCPSLTYLDAAASACRTCHVECRTGCSGAGPTACLRNTALPVLNSTYFGCAHVVDITGGVVTCLGECAVGKYPDGNSVCRQCSSSCSASRGCRGPSALECNQCTVGSYPDPATQVCLSCDAQCVASSGCTGAGPGSCNQCVGALKEGVCVTSCAPFLSSFYATTVFGVPSCIRCHPECAAGGCSGPGAMNCLSGCQRFFNPGTGCVPTCAANTYVSDSPQANSCHNCSSLCAGGCSGPAPAQCTTCTVARARSGPDCVAACQPNEVVVSGTCSCPAATAFVNASNVCQLCHPECANGCTGPGANQCLGGSAGCRTAMHLGSCVSSCPDYMHADSTRTCVCDDLTYRPAGSSGCLPCDAQCFQGCTGAGPTRCTQCVSVKLGASCVDACPSGFQQDTNRVCAQCDVECTSECLAPANPSSCVSCKNFRDAGACVSGCPTTKKFVDGNKNCLTVCPVDYPFYNDTSTASESYTTPQLCVASCALIPGPARSAYPTDRFRCSLPAQMPQASSSSTDNSGAIIAGVVVGLAIVVAVAVLLILHYRARKRAVELDDAAATPRPSTRASKIYDNPVSADHHVYDEFVFDPALDAARATGSNDAPQTEITTSFLGRPTYTRAHVNENYGRPGITLGHSPYDSMEPDELETSRM